jgi:hypothetical protein
VPLLLRRRHEDVHGVQGGEVRVGAGGGVGAEASDERGHVAERSVILDAVTSLNVLSSLNLDKGQQGQQCATRARGGGLYR